MQQNRSSVTEPLEALPVVTPAPQSSSITGEMQAVAPRPIPTTENVIELRNAEYAFSEETGVFDLSFNVPRGSICGMIGPSGCGKTTSVRLMTGLLDPQKGHVSVLGREPRKFSANVREKIGYMPQHFVLYPNLTVWENLSFAASLYGMNFFTRGKRLKAILDFVELSDAKNRLGSQLSGGMRRRLQLACTLVHDPQLIFADEPTAGIDPILRSKFWDHFRSLRDQGRTLFVTTQYVGEAAYCDMVCVMREGRIIAFDTPQGLRKRALGGEVIRLDVDPSRVREASQLLESMPAVYDVQRSRSRAGLLLVYTDDAGARMPNILAALNEGPKIQVKQAEEYQPSYDDVFVQLIEQSEQANV